MKQSTASLILKILILMLAAMSVLLSTLGPAVAPEDAPADQFSAFRALKHVKAIAKKPHAIGTTQHEEVRRYLISEINALALNPEIQTTTIVRSWSNGGTATNLSNVMARLIGREKGKAVLLVGHYDSAPNSFGAADNGAAVAAMLETLRILKADSQLRNDVIFLFTDAEEFGLLGAQAFVERHPWAEEVGMVINLDARGTSGPVFMFETSPGNGLLIKEFHRAIYPTKQGEQPPVWAPGCTYVVYAPLGSVW